MKTTTLLFDLDGTLLPLDQDKFILEYFRAKEQTLYLLGFPVSQLVSIACILIGVVGICVLLIVNNRKKNSEV